MAAPGSSYHSDLPSLPDFRNNHLEPVYNNFRDGTCVFCLEDFQPGAPGIHPKLAVIRARPCGHEFHKTCLRWTTISTAPNRNRCPTCRKEWWRINALEPEKAAEVWGEDGDQGSVHEGVQIPDDVLGGLSVWRYKWLMMEVDAAFLEEVQRPIPNFIGIMGKITAEYSHMFTRQWTSLESRRESDEYIYFEICSRIYDRMFERQLPVTAPVKAIFHMMEALYEPRI